METDERDIADPNTVEPFVRESEFADLHECLKNLLLDVLHVSFPQGSFLVLRNCKYFHVAICCRTM